MSFPNTAPITGAEKAWGVAIALLMFPIGLLAAIGLFSDQGWARWVALVLAVVGAASSVAAVIWLLAVALPGANYPFGPWLVILAAVFGAAMAAAAGAFWRGLRSTETE